jgi:signal transduction histidine kinase
LRRGVGRTLRPSLLLFLLAGSLAAICLISAPTGLIAQIAPQPYTVVPGGITEAPQDPMTAAPSDEPTASIRGWSFGGEVEPTELHHDSTIILDPGQPEIVLFFDATPYAAASTEFRYRLDDYDSDWTVTPGRIAHYRRLAPGHYHFEVQAHLRGRPWRTVVAVLPLVQRPFFHQTGYFYLMLLLGLVALAAQLLSQRDQLLKGQMGMVLEERNRIASDCHDSLMAGFAAVSWQLEATAKLFRDADAEQSPAAVSCELARNMVAHCQAEARRIIWDLRDSEELTNILSQALSRAITAHRLHGSLKTTFEVQGKEIPIAPAAVHHLVCIGQEAVSNAIRHAQASTIDICLRYESDSLCVSIRDNGRGFLTSGTAMRTGHFGIPVMEERARKLGGVLRLSSSAEMGTEVAVTVSFQSIHQPTYEQPHIIPWIGV